MATCANWYLLNFWVTIMSYEASFLFMSSFKVVLEWSVFVPCNCSKYTFIQESNLGFSISHSVVNLASICLLREHSLQCMYPFPLQDKTIATLASIQSKVNMAPIDQRDYQTVCSFCFICQYSSNTSSFLPPSFIHSLCPHAHHPHWPLSQHGGVHLWGTGTQMSQWMLCRHLPHADGHLPMPTNLWRGTGQGARESWDQHQDPWLLCLQLLQLLSIPERWLGPAANSRVVLFPKSSEIVN